MVNDDPSLIISDYHDFHGKSWCQKRAWLDYKEEVVPVVDDHLRGHFSGVNSPSQIQMDNHVTIPGSAGKD